MLRILHIIFLDSEIFMSSSMKLVNMIYELSMRLLVSSIPLIYKHIPDSSDDFILLICLW